MEQKQFIPPYPWLKSNALSCLFLTSSLSVTCVFFQDQNFFTPQIYIFIAPLPKGLLFSSGTKGIPSTHAFHYCLNSFSADHDCISTCQQSPLRREIQFFLRRKIIWYFISQCSSHYMKKFNTSSR